jgi:(2Fe-2S) ferredoxin
MPKPRTQILVCCNERDAGASKPCCAARGGVALYQALKDGARDRGLRDEILVTRTGCLKHCSRGVTVAVWPANDWYGGASAADAGDILDAAKSATFLARLAMPDGPWE